MKILRTIVLVLAALGFLIFAAYNWQPVELTLWQNLVLETKVPMLALLAFLAGFLPMWALHRSVVWGLQRRVRALESSLRNSAAAYRADHPAVTGGGETVYSPVDKSGKTHMDDGLGPAGDGAGEGDGGSDGGSGDGGDGGCGGGD